MFDDIIERGFDILTLHHAEAILMHDMSSAVDDLEEVLSSISIPVLELIKGGGGASNFTQRLGNTLANEYDWPKHHFVLGKTIDGVVKESTSHEVDHVRVFPTGTFALEIEWNNKDPFYDRDLENFKRLHSEGAISIGSIITRGESLQDSLKDIALKFAQNYGVSNPDAIREYYTPTPRQLRLIDKRFKQYGSFEEAWAHIFVSDKFGTATTHWRKLVDRVNRGVGNPCPLLLIGIPSSAVHF